MSMSVSWVRRFLRDNTADDNFLLDDVEFTDDEIQDCMMACVEEWNETTPNVRNYSVASFPYRHHWMIGTKGHLFAIAAANYARNSLSYSAGGISINDKDKATLYQQMSDRYHQEWKTWMKDKKRSLNAEDGYMTLTRI